MLLSQVRATADQLQSIATQLREIAQRSGRADLTEKFHEVDRELADTTTEIVVVGQIKQGKSALVNALVSAPVCPVDDVLATSVPTMVRWGEQPTATLVTEMAEDKRTIRTKINPAKLREHVTELAGESGLLGNVRAEITLPRQILSEGLVFIDTPGVDGIRVHAARNVTLLPQVDAAIMVTDATQELTEPELAFLKQAVALCPHVVGVMSKTDLQHQWRDILEANTEHIAKADIDIPLLPTSSLLHSLADRDADPELRKVARIDDLAEHLRTDVRKKVLADRHRSIAKDIGTIGEHLAMVIEAELLALKDPGDGKAIVQNLQKAEESAQSLMDRSARWQQTLSDGSADLLSDIEYDLRDRLRAVGREAEQLIDASDPGKSWEEIGSWLAESVTLAISDNFVWAHQRSVHLAEVVAQHFSTDGRTAVPDLAVADTGQLISSIGGLESVSSGHLSIGQKLMIGMKGSYGGVLMFGLMTTLAGMALVNPISIAAGLIMGGFAYRQEANSRLEQRRNEAKMAVRKLVDESIFQVSKEARDRISRIRRVLRDHFSSAAEDLKLSLGESVKMAKKQANVPQSERNRRTVQAATELQEIRALCRQAIEATEVEINGDWSGNE
ncbi:dynamin family protein [Gulosibacter chungangensis]|uniref:Isoniazid-inducible protein iniA n=1 Tax=Gulosibacter chungangensis TaxID=979746 RepID=A0A7J5BAM9_9MICO|nr:dynamin family protein [Gulosibacter chungangensis]KAB1643103.1 Isoniazid-inducible protein iniA [Gulosibacter chungangensis]